MTTIENINKVFDNINKNINEIHEKINQQNCVGVFLIRYNIKNLTKIIIEKNIKWNILRNFVKNFYEIQILNNDFTTALSQMKSFIFYHLPNKSRYKNKDVFNILSELEKIILI